MTITLPGLSGVILVYLLVFARTGAMVMLLPAIGDANVPGRVRLMLALAISLALAPAVASTYPQQAPASALALGLLIAQEVTVGILIGTMARIIMSSLSVAGFLIASQTGLSYAETLDPTSNGQQGAVIGNFFSLLGVVLIFATNLHHLAIGAVAGSYHLIPPGTGLPTGDMAQLTIKLVSGSFALGFQLAAPFLVFGFAVNAAFGLLARMMPQLQVFFVAMPVNILVGFLLMVLLLGTMMTIFLEFYTSQMGVFL
ncbi:MAG: flagellar type III secretion system protein FliR [Alphaproteobacteria bacterium]|nr:flagellar type III secretion system protein FliR [Alphaproteobacteria bacterium]MDE2109905.1 flagellar type III secretion system protein FliR [Alphaproteobacteria bacterium]